MAAKPMSSFRFWIADDAEVLRSLKNAFELAYLSARSPS
jgi:hypothetical protein